MFKAIKDFALEYGLIGAAFGLLSILWSNEPLSPQAKIKKVFASITVSVVAGSACMGFELNPYLTFAVCGGCCSFALEICGLVASILRIFTDKPLSTIKSLIDIIRGRSNDQNQNN